MHNYFSGSSKNPYHISVGAIVFDSEGKVACHCFAERYGLKNYYALPHETLEPNETLEQAFARGLMEELGVSAALRSYVGSLTGQFNAKDGTAIQKTTLYFTADLITQDSAKQKIDDWEYDAKNEWRTPAFLIDKLSAQAAVLGRQGDSEASMLKRLAR